MCSTITLSAWNPRASRGVSVDRYHQYSKATRVSDLKWQMTRQIPHLRRFARVLTGDPQRADDLVQDCLERALRKRRHWRGHGSVRSWLFRILYNVFLNDSRARRRRATVLLDEDGPPPECLVERARAERTMECVEVARALRRLPEEQRAAITLIAFQDVAYEEAARILDVPLGTLRSRLSRGREALREMTQVEVGDAPELAQQQSPLLRRVK